MTDSECTAMANLPTQSADERAVRSDVERLRALVHDHYPFVWRTLRALGLGDADVDDAAQQVMCVLARRIAEVRPGAERAFLFSTATSVVGTWRRSVRRHPQGSEVGLEALPAPIPSTEELIDERRAHEVLQQIIHTMPVELRVAFVLYEVEEMTTPAIASIIGVPVGTVASRLRRARELFQAIAKRMQAGQRTRDGEEKP
jgi:RNA polymerase sigma-70 factor (ECF subfamily)